nr:RNA-directed DNA polymerase [Pseudomonas graminis]
MSSRAIATQSVDRAVVRAHSRVGARYVLKADIAQFYPSIYTHAVPWAAHTKTVAKQRMKDLNLYGNLLDKELQACQHGQTKGIAIGPDTSLAIAELLLTSVDISLSQQCNILGGVRFIDDMELSFTSLSNAESALIALEARLYEYELQLNSNKTAIEELPSEIESIFVTQLRAFIPATQEGSPASWIDYFNRAFMLAKSNSSEGVLRYTVASLQRVEVTVVAWPMVQSLLWQCIALDPGCLRLVLDIVVLNSHRSNLTIDNDMASLAINSLVEASAPVGHGSEVLWSIWAAMVLEIPLHGHSQTLIAGMEDGCVATLATLAAHAGGVFDAGFSSALWESWLVDECFKQEHWMFAYECYNRGWYAVKIGSTDIGTNAAAMYLKSYGVTFLDPTAASDYVPAFEIDDGTTFTGY